MPVWFVDRPTAASVNTVASRTPSHHKIRLASASLRRLVQRRTGPDRQSTTSTSFTRGGDSPDGNSGPERKKGSTFVNPFSFLSVCFADLTCVVASVGLPSPILTQPSVWMLDWPSGETYGACQSQRLSRSPHLFGLLTVVILLALAAEVDRNRENTPLNLL